MEWNTNENENSIAQIALKYKSFSKYLKKRHEKNILKGSKEGRGGAEPRQILQKKFFFIVSLHPKRRKCSNPSSCVKIYAKMT